MTNYSYIVNVNKKNMAKAFSDKEKQQVIATLKGDAEQCYDRYGLGIENYGSGDNDKSSSVYPTYLTYELRSIDINITPAQLQTYPYIFIYVVASEKYTESFYNIFGSIIHDAILSFGNSNIIIAPNGIAGVFSNKDGFYYKKGFGFSIGGGTDSNVGFHKLNIGRSNGTVISTKIA